MTSGCRINAIITSFVLLIFFLSCESPEKKNNPEKFKYERFKDSVNRENKKVINDTSNIFDGKAFTPGVDSVNTLLVKIDTLWHRDAAMMEQMDTLIKRLKNVEKYSPAEKEMIKENIRVLDSFLVSRNDTVNTYCRERECPLFAAINKSKQMLYLFIDGELKDSFPVSTGMKKYRTPDLNVRPSGPLFTKYTSRKFPGGNYKGLGNMPYAVFVRGGYAIHGTTPGNFSKLGTVASHGCIRLHPDNARIFYELVKLFGLDHTWVSVRDSL
ncbi:MAG TPA: L,D-transpeptidase [Chitinophagaceae bacterium]